MRDLSSNVKILSQNVKQPSRGTHQPADMALGISHHLRTAIAVINAPISIILFVLLVAGLQSKCGLDPGSLIGGS
jgi:hypothetical protein